MITVTITDGSGEATTRTGDDYARVLTRSLVDHLGNDEGLSRVVAEFAEALKSAIGLAQCDEECCGDNAKALFRAAHAWLEDGYDS